MSLLIVSVLIISCTSYYISRNKVMAANDSFADLNSLPKYYGFFSFFWTIFPAIIVFCIWSLASDIWISNSITDYFPAEIIDQGQDKIELYINSVEIASKGVFIDNVEPLVLSKYLSMQYYSGLIRNSITILASLLGFFIVWKNIEPSLRARNKVESIIMSFMFLASFISIMTTLGIVLSLLFETIRFFGDVSPIEFFFGTTWSPQIALREGQVASQGSFGAIPVFAGTFMITIIAMVVATPIGLMSAVYLAEYSSPKVRSIVKPALELLAGIPTGVYGFFAALTVAPFIRGVGEGFGLSIASESAIAAGSVMGIMLIPFISSLSDDVMKAVPESLREGSYGLGATKHETIVSVIFPAALPGIIGSILLATSRAIGETMIVVMAAGLAAKLTANPFDSVTTVTVQIVTLLIGDHEFDSSKTMAAFALGLTLFSITLMLNVIALRVVNKYREKYD